MSQKNLQNVAKGAIRVRNYEKLFGWTCWTIPNTWYVPSLQLLYPLGRIYSIFTEVFCKDHETHKTILIPLIQFCEKEYDRVHLTFISTPSRIDHDTNQSSHDVEWGFRLRTKSLRYNAILESGHNSRQGHMGGGHDFQICTAPLCRK